VTINLVESILSTSMCKSHSQDSFNSESKPGESKELGEGVSL
jgi:hypothetical protein